MKCKIHLFPYVYKQITSTKTGEKYCKWVCPAKDDNGYCNESEWAKSKTPTEEMVNLLAQLNTELAAIGDLMNDMRATMRQGAKESHAVMRNNDAFPSTSSVAQQSPPPKPIPTSTARMAMEQGRRGAIAPQEPEIATEDIPF